MDPLLILRDALEQEEDDRKDSCDNGILIVPFDTSAHILGERIAKRMEYLLIQKYCSGAEATKQSFREFCYEIMMCKRRLIQNALTFQDGSSGSP